MGVSFCTLQINQARWPKPTPNANQRQGQTKPPRTRNSQSQRRRKRPNPINPKPRPLKALASIDWGHPPARRMGLTDQIRLGGSIFPGKLPGGFPGCHFPGNPPPVKFPGKCPKFHGKWISREMDFPGNSAGHPGNPPEIPAPGNFPPLMSHSPGESIDQKRRDNSDRVAS